LTVLRSTNNVCPLTPEVSGMYLNCVATAVTVRDRDGGVAPEDRSLKIREKSNVHGIIGGDRKVMFWSTVDSGLPRWPGNEYISI
jgi:hypothetical protein